MELSQQQRQELIVLLEQTWKNKSCGICSQDKWDISNTIFELREYHGGTMVLGGRTVVEKLIKISCHNCGNTKLLNIHALGIKENKLIDPEEEQGQQNQQGQGQQ